MDELGPLAASIFQAKYSLGGTETWAQTARRVTENVLGALGLTEEDEEFQGVLKLIEERKFMPGGRYLYASGRSFHQTQNCLLLRAEDTKEGWSDLMAKSSLALMTGAGIGVDYSQIRPKGAAISRTGGFATGPCSLMQCINEIGRQVMGGGARRAALWAGLAWNHPDIFDFIRLKDWKGRARQAKAEDHEFPLPMELTNVSVILDDQFFEAYDNSEHPHHKLAVDVYRATVRRMLKTAEPGFSVNVGENAGETLRNACTEVTSRDDSDVCNLGSLNLARIESLEEMSEATKLATLFLLAGTVYSDLPYAKVDEIRTKNRRLGLGLMGIHEWLMLRGKEYGPDEELADWLNEYSLSSAYAIGYAKRFGLSPPVKTRAIAPTGTIGIVAETTTGIEPVFCVAYIRRWSDANRGNGWAYDKVLDPTAKRLIDSGVDPESIEDAYSITSDRRIAFQAWMQKWVDHGISSTINLPAPITEASEVNKFGDMLYGYLPKLRGITVYPDGARSGQPITPISYGEAVNPIIMEDEDRCIGGVCGI